MSSACWSLPSPGDEQLAVLATRIVELVGRPYLASIGTARASNDGREHRQLMRNADLDSYHANNSGRSTSLSQLHSLPFYKIKIDRSFAKDRGDTASQNTIIRPITALGVSLGMSTIAEGVETNEQLARIHFEECTSVHGYVFSRPLPAEQIASQLAEFANHRPDHLPSIR